jgi:O-antigen ligase
LGGKRLPISLYYAALFFTPVALALSLTRSAWAGFLVGLLALLFLAQNKKAILKKGVIFIAIALPLVYLVANYQLACTLILPQSPDAPVQTVRVDQSQPNGSKPSNNTGQPQTELIPSGQAGSRLLAGDSISWRLGVVSRALEDWWQNPLIGNGANTFAQKYITSSNTPDWIGNMLLMTLHDSGLIGFGLFMGWFGCLFLVAFRSVLKADNRETAIIVLALCVSFAGLLVVFQFSSALWLGFSWLQLGLIRAGTLQIKAKSAVPDRIAASVRG